LDGQPSHADPVVFFCSLFVVGENP